MGLRRGGGGGGGGGDAATSPVSNTPSANPLPCLPINTATKLLSWAIQCQLLMRQVAPFSLVIYSPTIQLSANRAVSILELLYVSRSELVVFLMMRFIFVLWWKQYLSLSTK